MDRWALQYGDRCTFVIACCDGHQLAVTFAKELKLRHCLNVWVDQNSMPRWGQLGCQGFIVGDASHHVVCKSTSAFMEVNELAFTHCETLVEALLASEGAPTLASLATLHPGAVVRLQGLVAKPELNGVDAIITSAASDATGGRCAVRTRHGEALRIKPENLALATAMAQGGGCGGCGGGGGCGEVEEAGCKDGGCAKEGCAKRQQSPKPSALDAAKERLALASKALLEGGREAMPARMLKALQKEEDAARAALAKAAAEVTTTGPAPPVKKEAFKGTMSLGVCANALCMCAECECGAGCTCNVSEAETCEPCTTFRAAKAAKTQETPNLS